MKSRRLGSVGRRVSEVGFGGWAIGGDKFETAYGPVDDRESMAAIHRALELGVTFFDTSDLYGHGHSEALIGRVLSEWPDRDSVTVATKGGVNFYRPGEEPEGDFTPYGIAHAVELSRARLRKDSIALYMLMNPPIGVLLENDRVLETLSALRRAGKITAYGISVTDAEEGVALLKAGILLDAIEVTYNMFFQSAAVELLPLAKKQRVAVIAREPLANGFLAMPKSTYDFASTDHRSAVSPEYLDLFGSMFDQLDFLKNEKRTVAQAALRFVLDQPEVTTVIPGTRFASHVEENCLASELPPLTQDELNKIHAVFFPEDENS